MTAMSKSVFGWRGISFVLLLNMVFILHVSSQALNFVEDQQAGMDVQFREQEIEQLMEESRLKSENMELQNKNLLFKSLAPTASPVPTSQPSSLPSMQPSSQVILSRHILNRYQVILLRILVVPIN